jgi:uncharacterized protein DUF6152
VNRVLSTCLALSVVTAANAHHSPAIYDVQRTITLSGSVAKYEWGNPHVYIHVRVAADADSVWQVEAGSPTVMERSGWSKDSLRVGDQVVVQASPARNSATRLALLGALRTEDGRFSHERGAAPSALPSNPVAATSLSGNWLPTAPAFFRFVGQPMDWPLTDKARSALATYTDSQNGSQNCVSLSAPFLMVWHDLKQIEVGEDTTIIRAALIDDVEREVRMHAEAGGGIESTNQGHSIGHWEGEVLIVETTGFLEHASGIREGVASSPQKHLIERFELSPDRTRLTYSYELEDPEYLSRPVTGSVEWVHRPDLTYTGYQCDPDVARRFLLAE